MEVLYSQPFLITETAEPEGFPQAIDFTINGRPYVGNTSFEPYRRDAFRHRSIQAQRESIDLDNIPGQGTINTEGLWRREADDWHFGAGQPYQDRKGSVDGRFSTSKGINPWMQWQCELLNDTVNSFPLAGDGQVLRAGQSLWVFDYAGAQISRKLSANAPWFNDPGFSGSGIRVPMATDGFNIWILQGTNILKFTSDGTGHGPATPTGAFDGIYWVGERLMVTIGPAVYNIVDLTAALPAPLWTHPDPNFIWTAMCDGSSQIYMAGYDAGQSNSVVYRSTIEATGTALTVPVQALPMEGGEYVTSLYGYLNFVFVGSNLGVRMCRTLAAYDPTGNQGDLEAGPLEPGLFPPGPVSQPVQCMVGNNRFMYFGWTNYDTESTGIGRMDLSTFIDTQAPAFASDLMVPGFGNVTSMDWNPFNSAPIFVVKGQGVFTDAGYAVTSGTVDSGQIEYGISDNKILWAGDIGTVTPQYGVASMSVSVDGAAFATVGAQPNGGSPVQSSFPIGQIRGDLTTVRMTLTRDIADDGAPILHRWTLKALPAITAGTTISAVVLLYKTMSARGADQYFNAYTEYQYLYNLRTTQTVVQYQEGPFSAMCVIDELDWLPFKESDADPQGGFLGDLIVYLKTVDIGA
jgi:hypothetical protein